MKTIKFEILKDTVFDEVNKHTSYEGAKTDVTLYDKVRVKSGDKTLLERWWADACGMVTTILTPYVTGISNNVIVLTTDAPEGVSKEGFTITAGLPDNWNVAFKGKMQDALATVITEYIQQQWYLLLNMEGPANVSQGNQQNEIAAVGQMLYARVRPTRPVYEEDMYGE